MPSIDSIVEELKTLPPERLEQAAVYIHHLRQESRAEMLSVLERTAGSLSAAEADDWAKQIQDCEQIDESGW